MERLLLAPEPARLSGMAQVTLGLLVLGALASAPARAQCRSTLLEQPVMTQWPNQALHLDGETFLAGSTDGVGVFVRQADQWENQTTLFPTNPVGSGGFGWSLEIEGDTAVVGNPYDRFFLGAAYVFERSGTSWSSGYRLEDSTSTGYVAQFGYSVAVSGDTLLIGQPDSGEPFGNVRVYVRDTGGWTEQAQLVSSDKDPFDAFGEYLAIQGDVAVVGAMDAWNGTGPGAVYIFERQGTLWSETRKLIPSAPESAHRYGAALSFDGSTLVVGAPNVDSSHVGPGSAYVYLRSGTSWIEQARLVSSRSTDDDRFGGGVSHHGDRLIVGAYQDGGGGRAYLFERTAGSWSETTSWDLSFVSPDARRYAMNVALHGSVGAAADQQGRVTLFELDPGVPCTCFRNGTLNPAAYSGELPTLGTLWHATVDTSAVTGATSTWILGYARAAPPVPMRYGELLVDLASEPLFISMAPAASGASLHTVSIPDDPAMAGIFASSQAVIFGLPGTLQLCNALDMTIGS